MECKNNVIYLKTYKVRLSNFYKEKIIFISERIIYRLLEKVSLVN